MSIPTYTLGYPPDGSSLGETKPVIRNNLDGTFETVGIDHVNNNGEAQSPPTSGNSPGYHTIIHQVTQVAAPAAISGVNQVFSLVPPSNIPPGGDTQLFNLTGGGGLSQMTGDLALQNGYVWCAGILIQWGLITPSSSGETINFTPKFPNACFNVQLTPAASNRVILCVTAKSAISFTFQGLDPASLSGQASTVYWVAIGN